MNFNTNNEQQQQDLTEIDQFFNFGEQKLVKGISIEFQFQQNMDDWKLFENSSEFKDLDFNFNFNQNCEQNLNQDSFYQDIFNNNNKFEQKSFQIKIAEENVYEKKNEIKEIDSQQMEAFETLSTSFANFSNNKKTPFLIVKDAKKKIINQEKLKNECKYITLVVISALKKTYFYKYILEFAQNDKEVADETINYFTSIKQQIGGFQKLKEEISPDEQDSEFDAQVKNTFKQFMVWFLKNRYIRYIVKKGKMDHSLKYLNYKNQVMLKNLQNPSLWKSNTFKKISKKKN